jgi:Flp pilus assembly protein TadD
MEQGRLDEGIVHFREAARLENDDSRFHYNLAVVLSRSGKDSEAVPSYLKAL